MKIKGEFVVRQVLDNTVALPVGETALKINGMILLNEVSLVIWNALEQGADKDTIINCITDTFAVDPQEARKDLEEFLEQLEKNDLLTR